MKIYMAAVNWNNYTNPNSKRHLSLNEYEKRVVHDAPHVLESYHYVINETYVNIIRNNNNQIFLDSGAYSAFTLGVTINLKGYCDYIKTHDDIILKDDNLILASVLDGIGNAQETYENQLAMENYGIRPLPCFHAGEDERYLEYYIKNYDYITLGGLVGGSINQLRIWLDRMWDKYLTDGSGNPRLKVHGFGITTLDIMERYPWYSVDSSTWLQTAAFGSILLPDYGAIAISTESPQRHMKGSHVFTLTPPEREYVENMLLSQGFNAERLSTNYDSRCAYNIWSYNELNKQINKHNKGADDFISPIQELF